VAKVKNTGLGKGLEAIFLDNSADTYGNGSESTTVLRISEIEPRPDQPRKVFEHEALSQLADSIATHGLIQPIIVRNGLNGFYRIVAGERRWRAAKMAGLNEVPVIIMDIDDKKASEIALIENIQREDLNAIEEAFAYRTLMTDFDMTQEEVSKSVGRSRSAVANSLRLLDLPESVYDMVNSSIISAGHARALLGLKNESDMIKAAELIRDKDLSVRETEELVRSMNRPVIEEAIEDVEMVLPADNKKIYKTELEHKMFQCIGHKIKIKKSRIEIEYIDNEDLESIIKILCGDNIFDELI